MKKDVRFVGGTSKDADKKDTEFLLEQYRVVSSDRLNHNELFWNVPMMFLTAQSFLLVIALGGFDSVAPWQRAIGAFISFAFGILSVQIFERNRINEIADAELLLDIERHFLLQGYRGNEIHRKSDQVKYLNGENVQKTLESRKTFKFFSKGVSYELWKKGMWLITVISAFMFFYNLFAYFREKFLWLDSFDAYIKTLDKAAVSTLIIIFASNWFVIIIDLIAAEFYKEKLKDNDHFKNKETYLKRLLLFELLCVSLSIAYSFLARIDKLPIFTYLWSILLGICALSIFVYYKLIYKGVVRFDKNLHLVLEDTKSDKFSGQIETLILAGGQNIRLNPLIDNRVKFLDIKVKSKPLLENTVERNKKLSEKQIILTTDALYQKIIDPDRIESDKLKLRYELLPDNVPSDFYKQSQTATSSNEELAALILHEPNNRGTATAIYFYLWRHKERILNHSDLYDPVLIIVPSDHVISDEVVYFSTMRKVCHLALEFKNIYLLGIVPTYASTQYGYIQVNNTTSSVLKVEAFIEKPSFEQACKLVKKNFVLWNSGIFVARRSVLFRAFSENWEHSDLFPNELLSGPDLERLYDEVPESSFDRDVLESVDNLFAVPVSFDWIDVGDPQRLQSAIFSGLCEMRQTSKPA